MSDPLCMVEQPLLTVPAAIAEDTLRHWLPLEEYTAAPRPYLVSFANEIASSSVLNLPIHITGPKI